MGGIQPPWRRKCSDLSEMRIWEKGIHCQAALGGNEEMAGDGEVVVQCCSINHETSEQINDLLALLRLSAQQKDVDKGRSLHVDVIKCGLVESNIYVGVTLLNLYTKCGALSKAQGVFFELPLPNAVSWNVLIAGYAEQGHGAEALRCFEQMQADGISPNALTFLSVLKACGSIESAAEGEKLHAELISTGFFGNITVLGTALVDMYSKCCALSKAHQVFSELPVRDIVSWTVLISGYAQHGRGEEALNCAKQMQDEGFSPSAVTFACILKACSIIGAAKQGEEIYDEIVRRGLLEKDGVLGTALVDMCAKCGALGKAQQVFDELSARDGVTWNALIAGYCQHDHGEKALSCFEQMKHEHLSPDAATFACVLKACGNMGAADKGKDIHDELSRNSFFTSNSIIGNALVDMYAKCGALLKAQEVFDELPSHDVVAWNALITGYSQHGHGQKALHSFGQMKRKGYSPDAVTFASTLKACGSIGAADKGTEIHSAIVRGGLLEKASPLWSALVDMYAKCGAVAKAQAVFDKLPIRDMVAWTALIAGYAHVGKHKVVFEEFKRMVGEGLEPSLVTFIVMLNACSYLGLVDKAQMYYEAMTTSYGIIPSLEHHTCMVDLFSRMGHFDKATTAIKKMPSCDHLPAWFALLGACRKSGNANLGRVAFENAVRLDKSSAVA